MPSVGCVQSTRHCRRIVRRMTNGNDGCVKDVLARSVRTRRQDAGLSQHDLAAEAGVRQALISEIEIGSANPTLETLEKIARALDVGIGDLLSGPAA